MNNQLILIEDLGIKFPKETSKTKRHYAIYKCFCGETFNAQIQLVNSKKIKSCGCLKTTHGLTNHRLYYVWHQMIDRCNNKNNKRYENYGGRGIKVCNEWHNVQNFINDMYSSYQEGLSLDRKDVNGNYEKINCRWVSNNVQARNTQLLRKDNKTGYRGVTKKGNKFISRIVINGKCINLGTFKESIEAAKTYDKYIIDNNLEHTKNF